MIVRDKLREELWLSGAYSVEQNPPHCSALFFETHESSTTIFWIQFDFAITAGESICTGGLHITQWRH